VTTTLFLVRHAAIDWSGRVAALEDGLSELGRRQASALAERLVREGIDVLYSSPLRRAQETTQILGHRLSLAFRLEPELREREEGEWAVREWEEVKRLYPELVERLNAGDPEAAPPGGETLGHLQDRAVAVFGRLLARHLGQRVLAVSHQGVMAAFLCHVLGLSMFGWGQPRFLIDNASLSIVEEDDSGLTLICLNETGHLAGLTGKA